ncbi:ABC transporter permease (plasmid) [Staphylococcus epidermidis]|nr:ABC transporter permease [Staphylococcus epidermidis]
MAKPYKLTTHYLYGSSDSTYFDMINPILIGFLSFLYVFNFWHWLIKRAYFWHIRTFTCLSNKKRSEIIFGYVFGYGSFSVIQTIVVVLYAIYILHIDLVGSIWFVLLTAILTALVAVTFGILLSTFASSEFQMIQFIPLVIVPQVLFAGIIPIESMNKGLQYFSHIMPLFYTGQTMQNIMIKGYGFNDIYIYLIVLFAFFIFLLILNIIGMKRYRKV